MNENVNILLATYNGETYLENQLLSLIAQTHRNWTLFIHDDNSIDKTSEIICRYQKIDSRINFVRDGVVCGGAGKNFLHLLQYVQSEFIIFCDQDDIWFERKIEILLMNLRNKTLPCAIYCNAYGYSGEDITTDKVTLFLRTSLKDSLFLNGGVQGCNLMFNSKLLEIIKDQPEYVFMHDHYITIAAIVFGKLEYVNKNLMFYRQHDKNVTGNIPLGLIPRIKTFFNLSNPVIDQLHFKANQSFFIKFAHMMTFDQQRLFKEYFKFATSNRLVRVYIIWKNDFMIGKSKIVLLIKTLIRKPI